MYLKYLSFHATASQIKYLKSRLSLDYFIAGNECFPLLLYTANCGLEEKEVFPPASSNIFRLYLACLSKISFGQLVFNAIMVSLDLRNHRLYLDIYV